MQATREPAADPSTVGTTDGWPDLVSGWTRDAACWALLLVSLGAFRFAVLLSHLGPIAPVEVVRALIQGARFDAVVASIAVVPAMALAFLRWLAGASPRIDGFRQATVSLAIAACGLVCAASYVFFAEFGVHLDGRALAILQDEDGALADTILRAHVPLGALLCFAAATSAAVLLALQFARDRGGQGPGFLRSARSPFVRAGCIVALAILMVGLLRGFSWETSPVRIRNAYVTADHRLNRTIPTPFATFLDAMENRVARRQPETAENVRHALGILRGSPVPGAVLAGNALAGDALERVAGGAPSPPEHVFVLVMEGQHGFPLLEPGAGPSLFPALAALARQGAHVPLFVASGQHTDNTLAVLMAGVYMPGINLLYEDRALGALPTAIAPQFERIGFRTRFFYGGPLGWSRLEQFASAQGFAEVHGRGQIAVVLPQARGNAWGVWDQYLFDYVLRTVDPAKPSFNMIMTTTNHSPFNLDSSLRRIPDNGAVVPPGWDDTTRNVLAHEQYADWAVGEFVAELRRKYPRSLVVLTADHAATTGQFHASATALFLRLTVPLILLGHGVDGYRSQLRETIASHLDIAPTLLELCAPAGFRYRSLGENLLSGRGRNVGIGPQWIMTRAGLWSEGGELLDPFPGTGAGTPPADAFAYLAATRTVSQALVYGIRPK